MPIVAPREILMDAYSSGYAIGAFNATNLMEIGFIIEAAQSVASPVIIQTTEFVARTGVDALAPAVGTAHGLYKQAAPALDIDRLATINILLSDAGRRIPLVLHGGTGLPPNTVRQCIDNGIAKLNIGTDLKKALIDTTFDYISAHRYEYDPGKIDEQVKPAIQNRVLYWIKMLGSAARARSSPFVSSYRQG